VSEVSPVKYKNKKTERHGVVFDSIMEADYYEYLLLQKEKGIVAHIERQPVYLLQPAFKKKGRTIRKIEYKSDFFVVYEQGSSEVIDVKGVSTALFKLKAKLFDYYFPDLDLKIVTKHRGQWVEMKSLKKKVVSNGGKLQINNRREGIPGPL
jgi:hypothetical protein